MRYTWMVLLIVAVLWGAIPPSMVAAGQQLDSVLGVPWGASPEQARKHLTANGYSFVWEGTDAATGSQVLELKGSYAALPANISVYFMNLQMWRLDSRISDEEIGIDYSFDTLNKLLTEKYGQRSRDETSHNSYVPVTKYIWNKDGNSITITLSKMATFYANKYKASGGASVSYENIRLYDVLKKNI